MGREVRMVPADWVHPKDEYDRYKPLYPGEMYAERKKQWEDKQAAEGMQAAIDWCGNAPDINDFMPNWPREECTHYMMYEDTSEGTPISPAFATAEELAHWLADNNASAFGREGASYESWLAVCKGAWAPSMVIVDGALMSGVEAAAKP